MSLPHVVAALIAASAILGCGGGAGSSTANGGSTASAPGSGGAGESGSGGAGGGGSGGAPANLCTTDACGGDVVGLWEFVSPCLPPRPAPVDDCGGGQNYFQTRVEGTIDLHADGTDVIVTRLAHLVLSYHPVHCLPTPSSTCEDVFQDFECEIHDGFCDCISDLSEPYEASTETYEIDGNTLTFIDNEGIKVEVSYCASGSWLRYSHEGNTLPETLQRVE